MTHSLLFTVILLCLYATWKMVWKAVVPSRVQIKVVTNIASIAYGSDTRIDVTVANDSWLPVPFLELRMVVPEGLMIISGGATQIGTCTTFIKPKEEIKVSFTVRGIHRGSHRISLIKTILSDGFGTLNHNEVSFHCEITVHPRLLQSDARSFYGRTAEPGRHPALHKMSPTADDWIDIRPYREGDTWRDISWVLSARSKEWMVLERPYSVHYACAVIVNCQVEFPYWRGTCREVVESLYEWAYAQVLALLRATHIVYLYSNASMQQTSPHQRLAILQGDTRRNCMMLGDALGKLSIYAINDISSTVEHVRALHRGIPIILVTSGMGINYAPADLIVSTPDLL